jgi:hypothetical protein
MSNLRPALAAAQALQQVHIIHYCRTWLLVRSSIHGQHLILHLETYTVLQPRLPAVSPLQRQPPRQHCMEESFAEPRGSIGQQAS